MNMYTENPKICSALTSVRIHTETNLLSLNPIRSHKSIMLIALFPDYIEITMNEDSKESYIEVVIYMLMHYGYITPRKFRLRKYQADKSVQKYNQIS